MLLTEARNHDVRITSDCLLCGNSISEEDEVTHCADTNSMVHQACKNELESNYAEDMARIREAERLNEQALYRYELPTDTSNEYCYESCYRLGGSYPLE